MAGLDPAIRRGTSAGKDGRVKPGHDGFAVTLHLPGESNL
jgi:hypothetical protein